MSRASRCLLYAHHISARAKIQSVQRLASHHKVNGIFKVGKPGYIFLYGDETAIDNSWKSLKSLNWQYITIRSREDYTTESPGIGVRRPTIQKVETMDEFWDAMRRHKLEQFLFKALYREKEKKE